MTPVRCAGSPKLLPFGLVLLAVACLAAAAFWPRTVLAQDSSLFLPYLGNNPIQPPARGLITPAEGGTVRTEDGRLELVVGPGVVTEPLRATLQEVERTPPPGAVSAGLTVDISFATLQGKPVTQLPGYAILRVSTREVDPAQVTPQTVGLYHQMSSGEWEPVIDQQQGDPNLIEAWVRDFSAFGLFGKSTLRAVRGLAAGEDGSVYWFNEEDAAIYRRMPNGSWRKHHQMQVPPYPIYLSQRSNNLLLDRATGSFYVVADNFLRKVLDNGTEIHLYEANFDLNEKLSGAAVDPATGALYLAAENNIMQLDPASGAVLGRPISAPANHSYTAIAADGKGRLFALAYDFGRSAGRMDPAIQEWHNLFVIDLGAQTPVARPVASGFVSARGLAVDSAGTVYVANEGADVISVLGGDPLAAAGRIETPAPWALAVDDDGVWSAAYATGSLTSRATGYRDSPLASQPEIQDAGGSVSGRGSAVTVQLAALDPVPAHHTLLLGDTPITDICRVDSAATRLVYCLPDIWDTFPTVRPDIWPEFPLQGAYRFVAAGLAPVEAGAPVFPDISSVRRWAPSSALVRDEWLVWSGDGLAKVRSLNALFADWTPERGRWLAVQMSTVGTYGFEVTDTAGGTVQRSVTVVAESPVELDNRWIVQPGTGATLRSGGAAITIPPGALPGSQPYTVTLDIRMTEPGPDRGDYTGFSNAYHVSFWPEPQRLNGRITIRLPFDPAALAGHAVGAVYDSALTDYTPILHRLGADSVEIVLPAGVYSAPEDAVEAAAAAPDVEAGEEVVAPAAETPNEPTGERPRNAINTVTKGLWWITGLANAQWESEHFIVRYHGDRRTGGYASSLIQALEKAYTAFEAAGFDVPAGKTIARVTPAIPDDIDGFAPTVGTLSHWYMYFNDGLSPQRVKAVAAHEFFHIVQQTTMSSGGRVRAPGWWMEATAIWAEKLVFGGEGVVEYHDMIRDGCSFAHKSLAEYGDSEYGGGLTDEEEYGAGALAIYLEEEHTSAVRRIFEDIGYLTGVYAAMEGVVGDMSAFYQDFAVAYWGQAYADAAEWDLGACVAIQYLDGASNVVVDATGLRALSSRVVKAYVRPGSSIPHVDGTSGSVLRMALVGARAALFVLEGAQPPFTPIKGLDPFNATENDEGRYLESKLSDRTPANPYYFVAMNRTTAGVSERMTAVLEAPIISSCAAPGATAHVESVVSLAGAGFGPVQGSVSPGAVTAWTENAVSLKFTPNSAGSYGIRVQHANSALSNVCTITVK